MLEKFKHEAGGKEIVEIVDLRAKLYLYNMLDGNENKKKCKGISKNIVKIRLKLMTIERAFLADKPTSKQWMTLEVIVVRFLQKK